MEGAQYYKIHLHEFDSVLTANTHIREKSPIASVPGRKKKQIWNMPEYSYYS